MLKNKDSLLASTLLKIKVRSVAIEEPFKNCSSMLALLQKKKLLEKIFSRAQGLCPLQGSFVSMPVFDVLADVCL